MRKLLKKLNVDGINGQPGFFSRGRKTKQASSSPYQPEQRSQRSTVSGHSQVHTSDYSVKKSNTGSSYAVAPIGILAQVYAMRIPLMDRLALMDLIDSLKLEERLKMESIVAKRPDVLERAVQSAQQVKAALTRGDIGLARTLVLINTSR